VKYEFGPDAWRDNERERALLAEAIERLECGDNVEELSYAEMERIAAAAKAQGSNEAAVNAGEIAQDLLDNEAEKAYERSISDYHGGSGPQTMEERHQAAWLEHQEAHRR
jgi:hypothetical protein